MTKQNSITNQKDAGVDIRSGGRSAEQSAFEGHSGRFPPEPTAAVTSDYETKRDQFCAFLSVRFIKYSSRTLSVRSPNVGPQVT